MGISYALEKVYCEYDSEHESKAGIWTFADSEAKEKLIAEVLSWVKRLDPIDRQEQSRRRSAAEQSITGRIDYDQLSRTLMGMSAGL